MRQSRSRSLGSICVAVLMLCLMLTACGATSAAMTVEQRTATASARTADAESTAFEADTPLPTATTDPVTLEVAGCPSIELGPVPPQYGTVGGLKVSIPWIYEDYPSALMPNNLPNAPYQVPLTADELQVGGFNPNPPVNPDLSTGYALQICNQTSAPHTVSSLSVTIASFVPSSGPVTVWQLCDNGPYDAATKGTTGGCGGGMGPADWLAATLPNDQAGASAPATSNTQERTGSNLPFAIGPNQSILILVAVNGLSSQGTYVLSFGISLDGAAPAQLTPSDGSFFIAPSAVVWTGHACQTPAMQAQISPSSQDTYYVCPPSS